MDDEQWFAVKSVPTVKEARGPLTERVEIETREGVVVAGPGDYILREEDGHVYPIGGEKFEKYYERFDGVDQCGWGETRPQNADEFDNHDHGQVFASACCGALFQKETGPGNIFGLGGELMALGQDEKLTVTVGPSDDGFRPGEKRDLTPEHYDSLEADAYRTGECPACGLERPLMYRVL